MEHNDSQPLVELDKVCRRFSAGGAFVNALDDIQLRIERREYVAIMGPSGSGKSTLLNILGLLDRPSAGKYHLSGIDVSTLDDKQRSRVRSHQVGFVFQSFHLLAHQTALDNVVLGTIYNATPRSSRAARARSALEEVGLGSRASFQPPKMSGGERQRVAIARAVVADPSLLLCDEPTGNLDTKTGASILRIFGELRASTGVTVVVVTHDPEVAGRADRIVHLQDGKQI